MLNETIKISVFHVVQCLDQQRCPLVSTVSESCGGAPYDGVPLPPPIPHRPPPPVHNSMNSTGEIYLIPKTLFDMPIQFTQLQKKCKILLLTVITFKLKRIGNEPYLNTVNGFDFTNGLEQLTWFHLGYIKNLSRCLLLFITDNHVIIAISLFHNHSYTLRVRRGLSCKTNTHTISPRKKNRNLIHTLI